MGLIVVIEASKSLLRAIAIKKDHIGPVFASSILMVPAGSFMALYSWFFLEVELEAASQALPYMLVTIPCFVIGSTVSIKALEYLEASLHTIVVQTVMLSSLVGAAWLFLGETLYGWQWLGLTCLAIGIIATHSIGRGHSSLSRGLVYASLGASLIGLGLVVDKIILNQVGIGTFLFMATGMISLASAVFYLIWQKWHQLAFWPPPASIHWPALVACSSLGVISLYLYIFTLSRLDNVAYLNSVTAFSLVLAVLLEMAAFKEISHLTAKLIGVTVAVIGVMLLA